MISVIEKTKVLKKNNYVKPESNFLDKKTLKRLYKGSKEADIWA